MNLLALGLKNILRQKKRSLLTLSMIFFSVFFVIIGFSFELGMIDNSYRNLKDFETGTVQLLDERYFHDKNKMPLKYSFDPTPVINKLNNTDFKWSTRTYFQTEAIIYEDPYPQDASLYLQGIAVDPERERNVFKIADFIKEGHFIDKQTTNGVVIGRSLANKLGAKIGYPIIFTMKTKNKMAQVLDTTIVGIYNTPNPNVNRTQVFFSKNFIDKSLVMQNNVTMVAFKLNDLSEDSDVEKLTNMLKNVKNNNLKLYRWSEIEKAVVEVTKGDMGSLYFMGFFLFLIAIIGISNTTMMSINERFFEIGMLRSMGMASFEILKLFSYEGLLIGFFGGFLGIFFSIPVNYYMVHHGITMASINENVNIGYRVMGNLKSIWSFKLMLITFILACIISALFSYISARRAVKRKVVDCLREGL